MQVNVFDNSGRSPLFVAATKGISDVVSLLLAYGADPNLSADRRCSHTPLTVAVIEGHEEVAQTLIPGTAKLHRTRALAFAVAQGQRHLAEILLRNGAPHQFCRSGIQKSSRDNCEKWVQLLLFAVLSDSLELVELLVAYGVDVNVQCSEYPNNGFSKLFNRDLFWTVEGSLDAMVDLLLERGRRPGDC